MDPTDTIVYISDMGATNLKPLFITCGAVQGVIMVLTLILEYWLRRTGRLIHHMTILQKISGILAIVFLIVGEISVICCASLDLAHHRHAHHVTTFLFVAGVFVCCLFLLAEYFSLARVYGKRILFRLDESVPPKRKNYLYWSSWIRCIWTITATICAILYGALLHYDYTNASAVFEWVVGFLYSILFLIIAYDFVPASHRHGGFYGRCHKNDHFDSYAIRHQRDLDAVSESKSLPS